MQLSELVATLPDREILYGAFIDPQITGIAHNSQAVKTGDLFVAIEGLTTDGHLYLDDAIRNGAVAVIGKRRDVTVDPRIPYVVTSDPRSSLATVAAAFYGFPARSLRVIGVTGTDGKTTTSTLIHAILDAAGYRSGMLTTIGAVVGDSTLDTGTHVTTPDAVRVQSFLAQLVSSEAQYAVLETTSHALEQHRVRECDYDVAVITNITREHLDYHKSFEAYRKAKSLLFRSLLADSFRKPGIQKTAILNVDDESYEYLMKIQSDRTLTYGIRSSADVVASRVVQNTKGTCFTLESPGGRLGIEMSLIGEHNVYNALAAAAACYSQGVEIDAIRKGIESVITVSARMEQVNEGQDFGVFVDFAHTPNALEKILLTARQIAKREVIVIFGLSGGPRDKTKRPIMGEIAGRLADKIVITAVDWYDEDVKDVLDQIAVGCQQAGRQEHLDYWCIEDRREGIAFGISIAQPGDVVILAGKGHETSLSVAGVEQGWSEFGAARESLKARMERF